MATVNQFPAEIYDPAPNVDTASGAEGTLVDKTYMDIRDTELKLIEDTLGVNLIVGTAKPLVDYARIETEANIEGYEHVWLAHKDGSNARVNVGPVPEWATGPAPRPRGWLNVRPTVVPDVTIPPIGSGGNALVIENHPSAGITLLAGNNGNGNIYFSGADQHGRGRVSYVGADKELRLAAAENGGNVVLETGSNANALRLANSGAATFDKDVTVKGTLVTEGDTLRIDIAGAPMGGQSGDFRWNASGIHVNVNGTWETVAWDV